MPTPPVTCQRDQDILAVRRGDEQREVDLARLNAAWLIHIGDGFSGPDAHVLALGTPALVTLVPLEHHSVWSSLLADLRRLADARAFVRVEVDRLPAPWLAAPSFGLSSANVSMAGLPRPEFDRLVAQWMSTPISQVDDFMP